MNVRNAVAVACLALVSGCATPYQSTGFTGGFSETQLAPNVFRIRFNGNGWTSDERASDFALLRAAELSLGAGCKYFGLIDEAQSSSTQVISTPGTSSTYVYGSGNYATTTYNPGSTFFVNKPSASNTVACFSENPHGNLFDAAFLANSIRQKYRMSPIKTDTQIDAEVKAFLDDPKHPHARALATQMSALLNSGEAKDLEQAYRIAVERAGLK